MLGAIKVIVSEHAESITYDWSLCRSPSRAKRRHARGIKTRLVIERKPASFLIHGNTMVVHPVIYNQLREKLSPDVNYCDDRLVPHYARVF